MALIRFSCSGCQTTLKINNQDMVGKKIRCPKCSAICLVPAPSPPPQPVPAPAPVPAPVSAPAPEPAVTNTEDIETLFFESLASAEKTSEKVVEKPEKPAPAPEVVESVDGLDDWGQEEVAPARKKPVVEEEEIEEAPLRSSARKDEYEDEEEDEPPSKPARSVKKGGINFVAILAVLLALAYLGGVGAAWYGVFDADDPGPMRMTKEAAQKYLDEVRKSK